MSNTTPIERAERNLKSLLESLDPSETVTLVDSGGEPLAMLISLKPASAIKLSSSE
ncbi:MAG: hypothetical protein IT210_02215 [Armatimonadetes bacterium]|nr:hypothetical protein [Armatimonadota bacterium]